jgi:hypothetical protein
MVNTWVSNTCRLVRSVSGRSNWDDEVANSPGNGFHTEIVAVEGVWPVEDQG